MNQNAQWNSETYLKAQVFGMNKNDAIYLSFHAIQRSRYIFF